MRFAGLTGLLVALLFAGTCAAATLPRADAVPGGIALVRLPADTQQAEYEGNRVIVLSHDGHQVAVVGIPLDTKPGIETLEVTSADGKTQKSAWFNVNAKTYPVQRLTIKNKSEVTLSPANLARVKRERKEIDAIYDSWTPKLMAKLPFDLPVHGVETSKFGLRRVLNGKPRSPHSGIDIAAPTGTPVKAPAAGIVAAVDNYFFNGNTIIIDHGQGLVSVYVHLSKMLVHKGEHVARGQVIAKVGSTGRTTGSDLHWTVTLNGTRINPELLLSKASLDAIQ